MDDNYDFNSKPGPRLSDSLGEPPRQTSVPAKTENEIHTDVPAVEPATVSRKPRTQPPQSTREDFTGPNAPLQVKIPTDLIQSLKLHSISTGKTMSELVLECITSPEMLSKAWVASRKAA